MPNIEIFRGWCKSCGICVAFCPKGVLSNDELGRPFVSKPEECVKCRLCELRCPDFAITVEDEEKK